MLVNIVHRLFKKGPLSTSLRRFLFIRPGGIGDAVLLVPAIIALKRNFQHAVVDILAEKRNSEIFFLCPEVNRIFLYDNLRDLFAITKVKYDVVIDTEQWHRLSAVLARLTGAPMRIGYGTNERKALFTHSITYSQDDHEQESFFHVLTPLLGETVPEVKPPFFTVPKAESPAMVSFLQPLKRKTLVAIFPGGSIEERRWGMECYHALAQKLVGREYGIVVVGGNEDVKAGRQIAGNLPYVVDMCGKLSLIETASVLKDASLLITGDSGIMHIGYGLGVKIVALFGPGIEKKWAPRGENVVVINKHLPCSPCTKFGYTPRCDKGAECMKQITVDEVYEKAIELLER